MKLRYIIILSVLFSTICSAAENDKSPLLSVMVFHDGSDIWTQLPADKKSQLAAELQTELTDLGLKNTQVQFCGPKNNPDNQCHRSTGDTLQLDITLSALKYGKRKKGLSFSLEKSDPRDPVIGMVSVLPIICQLREAKTNQLLNMKHVQPVVKQSHFKGNKLNTHYAAQQINTVCNPLLYEEKKLKTALLKQKPKKIKTEDSDVYIEKKIIKKTESQDKDDTNNSQKKNDQPSPENKSVDKTKSEDGKTQYVIHNKGNKVTIEFGQDR